MLVGEPTNVGVTEPHANESRTDEQLIDALNRDDRAAFDTLYFRHRDWVVRLAMRFTNNHDLSLEVLQETFLYFVKKFPGFELTCQLRTFLYPVVRNLSLSILKKARRTDSLEEVVAHGLPEPATPPRIHNEGEELGAILAGLSEAHREVLMLRFVEEFSLQEIAEATDIALGTAKSRLHHALKLLRENPVTRKYFESLK